METLTRRTFGLFVAGSLTAGAGCAGMLDTANREGINYISLVNQTSESVSADITVTESDDDSKTVLSESYEIPANDSVRTDRLPDGDYRLAVSAFGTKRTKDISIRTDMGLQVTFTDDSKIEFAQFAS